MLALPSKVATGTIFNAFGMGLVCIWVLWPVKSCSLILSQNNY